MFVIYPLLVVGAFLFIESVFFYHVLTRNKPLDKAELIVVFKGQYDRIGLAYKLVDLDYAPGLLISPATRRQLKLYDRRYRPTRGFEKIIEEKARTTTENAIYTGNILKRNAPKTVILVTSWYHMPRSYLLLKLMLMGTDVKIYPCATETGKLNIENWYQSSQGWKMVYNEMVETWGSLFELTKYHFSNEMPVVTPGKTGLLRELKKILLFDINQEV